MISPSQPHDQRSERPEPRMLMSARYQTWLHDRLTARDRWLAAMLLEHHVLTTDQIVDLAFPTRRAANHRLRILYRWGLIDRFQPHRDVGSHPMHYVLDIAGAAIVAADHGRDPGAIGYQHHRETVRAHSPRLAHDVAANTLFTTLVARARAGAGELTAWWSATRCDRLWGGIAHPDGYGRWRQAGREIDWFVEYDTGSEALWRLADKLVRYHRLAEATGITTPVLLWLPTQRRETAARAVLTAARNALRHPDRVPVATTHPHAAPARHDMTQPRWLPLTSGDATARVGLVELSASWPDITPPPPTSGADTNPASARPAVRVIPAPRPMPPPHVTADAA